MSERSSVRLEQLLGDNYYIDKWSVDDPSPAVGDTVYVTLVVYDVFNEPVGGQTRTVTCTGGSFVGVNGQSITATDSVDVITEYGTGDVELELSVDVADVTIAMQKARMSLNLALEEAVVNVMEYAYAPGTQGDVCIKTTANDTDIRQSFLICEALATATAGPPMTRISAWAKADDSRTLSAISSKVWSKCELFSVSLEP